MPSAAAAENSVSHTLTPCCPAFASQSPNEMLITGSTSVFTSYAAAV